MGNCSAVNIHERSRVVTARGTLDGESSSQSVETDPQPQPAPEPSTSVTTSPTKRKGFWKRFRKRAPKKKRKSKCNKVGPDLTGYIARTKQDAQEQVSPCQRHSDEEVPECSYAASPVAPVDNASEDHLEYSPSEDDEDPPSPRPSEGHIQLEEKLGLPKSASLMTQQGSRELIVREDNEIPECSSHGSSIRTASPDSEAYRYVQDYNLERLRTSSDIRQEERVEPRNSRTLLLPCHIEGQPVPDNDWPGFQGASSSSESLILLQSPRPASSRPVSSLLPVSRSLDALTPSPRSLTGGNVYGTHELRLYESQSLDTLLTRRLRSGRLIETMSSGPPSMPASSDESEVINSRVIPTVIVVSPSVVNSEMTNSREAQEYVAATTNSGASSDENELPNMTGDISAQTIAGSNVQESPPTRMAGRFKVVTVSQESMLSPTGSLQSQISSVSSSSPDESDLPSGSATTGSELPTYDARRINTRSMELLSPPPRVTGRFKVVTLTASQESLLSPSGSLLSPLSSVSSLSPDDSDLLHPTTRPARVGGSELPTFDTSRLNTRSNELLSPPTRVTGRFKVVTVSQESLLSPSPTSSVSSGSNESFLSDGNSSDVTDDESTPSQTPRSISRGAVSDDAGTNGLSSSNRSTSTAFTSSGLIECDPPIPQQSSDDDPEPATGSIFSAVRSFFGYVSSVLQNRRGVPTRGILKRQSSGPKEARKSVRWDPTIQSASDADDYNRTSVMYDCLIRNRQEKRRVRLNEGLLALELQEAQEEEARQRAVREAEGQPGPSTSEDTEENNTFLMDDGSDDEVEDGAEEQEDTENNASGVNVADTATEEDTANNASGVNVADTATENGAHKSMRRRPKKKRGFFARFFCR